MIKRMALTILSAVILIVLVACGGNKVDDATSEKYITKAEEVVSLLNEGNYEEVHAMFDEEMKVGLPVNDMEELTPIIEGSGSFEEIDKSSIEEDDGFFITVLVATYSEENRVFTVTFNGKEEIAGLYIQ